MTNKDRALELKEMRRSRNLKGISKSVKHWERLGARLGCRFEDEIRKLKEHAAILQGKVGVFNGQVIRI